MLNICLCRKYNFSYPSSAWDTPAVACDSASQEYRRRPVQKRIYRFGRRGMATKKKKQVLKECHSSVGVTFLVGREIRKEFKGFGTFSGRIADFHRDTGYRIEYEDGDSEDLTEAGVIQLLAEGARHPVEPCEQPSNLSKASHPPAVQLSEFIAHAQRAARRKRKHTELKRSGVFERKRQAAEAKREAAALEEAARLPLHPPPAWAEGMAREGRAVRCEGAPEAPSFSMDHDTSLYRLRLTPLSSTATKVEWWFPPANPGNSGAWIGLFAADSVVWGVRGEVRRPCTNERRGEGDAQQGPQAGAAHAWHEDAPCIARHRHAQPPIPRLPACRRPVVRWALATTRSPTDSSPRMARRGSSSSRCPRHTAASHCPTATTSSRCKRTTAGRPGCALAERGSPEEGLGGWGRLGGMRRATRRRIMAGRTATRGGWGGGQEWAGVGGGVGCADLPPGASVQSCPKAVSERFKVVNGRIAEIYEGSLHSDHPSVRSRLGAIENPMCPNEPQIDLNTPHMRPNAPSMPPNELGLRACD